MIEVNQAQRMWRQVQQRADVLHEELMGWVERIDEDMAGVEAVRQVGVSYEEWMRVVALLGCLRDTLRGEATRCLEVMDYTQAYAERLST